MIRKSTWENDLADFISDRLDVPFEWGVNDCATYTADAVEAMTGVDIWKDMRGKYHDNISSRVALREHGNGTLLKTFQALLPEKPKAFAMRGDVIWNGFAVGICYGPVALFLGEGDRGLVRIGKDDWKRAFAVGGV